MVAKGNIRSIERTVPPGEDARTAADSPLFLFSRQQWLLLTDLEKLEAYRFGRLHGDGCITTLTHSLSDGAINARCHSCQSTAPVRRGVNYGKAS